MSEEIRPATEADLPAVAAIYRYYVENSTATWATEVPDLEYWRALLDTTRELGVPFLVSLVSGDVVGFAYLSPIRGTQGWRHTMEDTIYLRADATGDGRGRRLLTALLDAADPAVVRQVIAMISAEVTGSIALHAKLGFVETGRLPDVGSKAGLRLDCVIMQRSVEA